MRVYSAGQLMIGLGFPDPRAWTLALETATFRGTFSQITGVISVAHLRANDRSISMHFSMEPFWLRDPLPLPSTVSPVFCRGCQLSEVSFFKAAPLHPTGLIRLMQG